MLSRSHFYESLRNCQYLGRSLEEHTTAGRWPMVPCPVLWVFHRLTAGRPGVHPIIKQVWGPPCDDVLCTVPSNGVCSLGHRPILLSHYLKHNRSAQKKSSCPLSSPVPKALPRSYLGMRIISLAYVVTRSTAAVTRLLPTYTSSGLSGLRSRKEWDRGGQWATLGCCPSISV